jgi:sugar lactone lactonase YvrE
MNSGVRAFSWIYSSRNDKRSHGSAIMKEECITSMRKKSGGIQAFILLACIWLCGGGGEAGAQNYVWTTFVGRAGETNGGDGVGTNAFFNQPTGAAMDAAGNLYVTDEYNDAIRKVTPDGTVSTFAGVLGVAGTNDSSSGQPLFTQPTNLTFDKNGNIYVVDTFGYTIRKITPAGLVSTLAGKPGQAGSSDGTGSAAGFNQPNGICYDTNDNVLYVADGLNGYIRKVTLSGVVSTLSAAYFYGVEQVAVDANHRLYVCDAYYASIKTMDTNANHLTVLAGANQLFPAGTNLTDGTGMAARFNFPESIWLNPSGSTLFVADWGNNEVRKVTVTPSGSNGVVTTVGGNGRIGTRDGVNTNALFNQLEGIFVDPYGNLYVADTQNSTIRIGYAGPPVILSPPQSQTVGASASPSFAVSAGGAAPRGAYQWKLNGVALTNSAHISGAQSNVLTLNSVTTNDAGTYQVVVTNAVGATNASASLTVTQGIPVVTWTNPAPITYGMALGGVQLDATANVPGSFAYAPAAGTVLRAGTNALTAVFSPTDTVDYSSVTSSVGLAVSPAALGVTANNASRVYGGSNPAFTASYSGFVNGEVLATSDVRGSPQLTCGAIASSPVGAYTISNGLGTLTSTNYAFLLTNGTLTLTQASLTITASNATKVFGQTKAFAGSEFSASGLVGSDTVTLVALTSAGATNTASAGSYPIIPSAAIGSGLSNYAIAYVNGVLSVTPATPVEINTPILLTGGTIKLTFTGGNLGVDYRIQAKSDLLISSWSDLATNQAGSNGLPSLIDLDATNHDARFYRTVTP